MIDPPYLRPRALRSIEPRPRWTRRHYLAAVFGLATVLVIADWIIR